ncbi:MAG: hypothetical protein OXH96_03230 [Spirochaetaceae bacterium]|nr:hypothetical protein [Spirochaetaceae bacterium]
MVVREAEPLARTLAREFKVVAIVGPRQSGKTTLAREVFAAKPYASLEDPDLLGFAQEDPRRFLGQYPLKRRWNAGRQPNLFFWRSHGGLEVDLVLEQGPVLAPVEIKSGATVSSDWLRPLRRWRELAGAAGGRPVIVYGGDQLQQRSDADIIPWRQLARTDT